MGWRLRSCRFTLVTDSTLKKVDSNTRRIHKAKFVKKTLKLERLNSDPEYLRQQILEAFPQLSAGDAFKLWQVRLNKTELTPLPVDVNNAQALLNYEDLNRSCVYIKADAAVTSDTAAGPSQSSQNMSSLDTAAVEPVAGPSDNIQGMSSLNQSHQLPVNTTSRSVTADAGPAARPSHVMTSSVPCLPVSVQRMSYEDGSFFNDDDDTELTSTAAGPSSCSAPSVTHHQASPHLNTVSV